MIKNGNVDYYNFHYRYAAIILSEKIKLDKAAAALLTGIFCWAVYILQADNKTGANNQLLQNLNQISSILFFFSKFISAV